MIISMWHPGSGVGDQLFCYLAARLTATRLGVKYGMVGEFKGRSFMRLVPGEMVPYPFHVQMPAGKIVIDAQLPLIEGERWYDPEINFVEDNTIVDGCLMQDERYFKRYWTEIHKWLHVAHLEMSHDTCVIGFRGGEYAMFPELYLQPEFWQKAIARIKEKAFISQFEVHTDDPVRAKQMLGPLLPASTAYIHDVERNWRSVRYAKYLIIGNSAFYILPALLNQELRHNVIAPRFWARRNTQEWSLPQNFYSDFDYV